MPQNGPQTSTHRSPFVSQEDEEEQAELRVTRRGTVQPSPGTFVGNTKSTSHGPHGDHVGWVHTSTETGPPGPPRGQTGGAGQKIGTGQFQENWGPQSPCPVPGFEGVTRGPLWGRQRYVLRKGPEPMHSGGTQETDAVRCLTGADGSSEAIGSLEWGLGTTCSPGPRGSLGLSPEV